MRGLRVLSVCALALTSLTAVTTAGSTAATAAGDPSNVLAVSGPASVANLARDDLFAGSSLHVSAGQPDQQMTFSGHIPSGIDQSRDTLSINPFGGAPFALGTFPVSGNGRAGSFGIVLRTDRQGYCYANGGSLEVTDFATDPVSGNITTLAASFSADCDPGVVTGLVRFNSTAPFDAVSVSPGDWFFGSQLVGRNGRPREIRFTNEGADTVTYGAAKFSGGTKKDFRISHDGCRGRTVAPGHGCTVTVLAHPHTVGTGEPTFTTLVLPASGAVRDRVVPLEVIGSNTPQVQVVPAADRIKLTWGELAQRMEFIATHVEILRGTSPRQLTPVAHRRLSAFSFTDKDVKPGRTYYYRVVPVHGANTSPATPAVAAIAWPTYSAGMYHTVKATHLLHEHVVRAGHPYSFRVLGHHGIPKSGVAALALDVIADHPSGSTRVTVYPAGTRRPKAADLVAPAGHAASNFAITAVGKHGKVTVSATHGATPVTLDVSGYYSDAKLSHHFGSGAAQHIFTRPGLLADTKRFQKAPLPHGYYLHTPINFNDTILGHVDSVLVQVTAYGSKSDGTISAYATGKHIPGTTALAYRAGATTANTAIVPVGSEYVDSQARDLPSLSFFNRGPKPVQLIVTILGYYDDNTLMFGQRYHPTKPVRITSRTLGSGGPATLRTGSYASYWTTSLNLKVAASNPSASTTLSLGPGGFKHPFPAHPLLHLSAGQSLVASTTQPVGTRNDILVRNAHGHVAVSAWTFGRFQAWPAPRHTPSFANVDATESSARMARSQ